MNRAVHGIAVGTEPDNGVNSNSGKELKSASSLNSGIGRIPIVKHSPWVDHGRFPASCVAGETIPVTATVFREGHDALGVQVVLSDPDGKEHSRLPLTCSNPGLDYWEGHARPDREGHWTLTIESFSSPYDTWRHDAPIKVSAGQDVELMLLEGVRLLQRVVDEHHRGLRPQQDRVLAQAAIDCLRSTSLPPEARLAPAIAADMAAAMRQRPLRDGVTYSEPTHLIVHRQRALFGSWYEIFPRSIGARFSPDDGGWVSGTLRTAANDLPRIADMGFDVVYLTPIHPIGTTFRKGRNNTLEAVDGDPGSPYAIGSPDGGHDAIHPDLGTMEDFRFFVSRARELGLEVALDLALQCSPDHPWVQEHPEWFTVRADGTIAYAENPPKKYQDIYPLSFDTDYEGLYCAIRDVLDMWVEAGVTAFRVDNPHTKPVRFWEQLLAEFDERHPQVLFLAEAFTRPAMMHTLGKVGFHQSYTYFTWRHTPSELREYLEELVAAAPYMRPSFWPTTHDILTPFMSYGGMNAFRLRAVLAATLVPTWGVYSGYELIESVPRPGVEEQIDNEKYEYKPRDFESALRTGRSLQPLITQLNHIRRAHPALQTLTTIRFHRADHPGLIVFSKHLDAQASPSGHSDTVLVVCMTEHHGEAYSSLHLDLDSLGLPPGADFDVEDLLTGERFHWTADPFVILSADHRPAHILRIVRIEEDSHDER